MPEQCCGGRGLGNMVGSGCAAFVQASRPPGSPTHEGLCWGSLQCASCWSILGPGSEDPGHGGQRPCSQLAHKPSNYSVAAIALSSSHFSGERLHRLAAFRSGRIQRKSAYTVNVYPHLNSKHMSSLHATCPPSCFGWPIVLKCRL